MAVYRHRGVVRREGCARCTFRPKDGEKEKEWDGNGENEGNDEREKEREKKEGMRRGRIGRGFGMPRYRETEENESSAIGAYYGSHVLFW